MLGMKAQAFFFGLFFGFPQHFDIGHFFVIDIFHRGKPQAYQLVIQQFSVDPNPSQQSFSFGIVKQRIQFIALKINFLCIL